MRIFPSLKYTGNKGVYLYCLFFILSPLFAKAQSDKKLVKSALNAVEQKAYSQAIIQFERLESLNKQSESTLLVYLDCLVKRKELGKATQIAELIEFKTKGKPDVQYFFIKAMLDHLNETFDSSIDNYKKFIRLTDDDNPLREIAKANLLSCSYARRNNSFKEGVGILPFSKGVNTKGDDIKPIYSKNLNGVFYYASANEKSLGGLRDSQGSIDNESGQYKMDMLRAQRKTEDNFVVSPLSYLLNSTSNDILSGFSEDGQVLYFGKSNSFNDLLIYADTFEQNISKRKLKPDLFESINRSFSRLGLPCFYSDEILLFASDKLGGYGGYDLFVSYLVGNEWTKPENLGSEINTEFDEVTPFLSRNGRSLYFSTNNPSMSYGGFDVVHSVFKAHSFSWSEVKNLGKPINSLGDDLDFCLSNNGVSALLSSDRPDGVGGFDLYNFIFEKQAEEQLTQLSSFIFGRTFDLNNYESEGETPLILRPLYYGGDSELLALTNTELLEKLAKRLREDPALRLVLEVHTNDEQSSQINTYLAYQRGLKVQLFLEDFGVKRTQIQIRSFCSAFPLAVPRSEGKETYFGERANNRIDLRLWSMDDSFVEEAYEWPKLDSLSRNKEFDRLSEYQIGISYAVEVFQSPNNKQDPILMRYTPLVIGSYSTRNALSFQLGLFKNIDQAKTLLNSISVLGYQGARIVVFLNGYRLAGDELDLFEDKFPGISWP
jgi:outer membrane protein OmpA-like peptidoglycan-associated protein